MINNVFHTLNEEPVTILDIAYNVNRNGIIIPEILIDPPIVVAKNNNWKIRRVPVQLFDINNYDDIGVGSKIYLQVENHYVVDRPIDVDVFDTLLTKQIIVQLARECSPNLSPDTKRLHIKNCPSCGEPLRYTIDTVTCTNRKCITQILKRCMYYLQSIGVYLHGPFYQILCMLVSKGIVKDIPDLYSTSDADILAACIEGKEEYVKTYKELICKPIGHVSMYDLLIGLDVFITTQMDNELQVRSWVAKMCDEIRTSSDKSIFNISTMLDIVDGLIRDLNITPVEEEHFDRVADFHNQIVCLADKDHDDLHSVMDPLNDYQIALLFSYCYNPETRSILHVLDKINLVGV